MKKSKYNIFVENGESILLFNTMTLALLELEKSSYERFFSDNLTNEEISLLKSVGAISKFSDEKEILKYKYNKKKFSKDTLNLTIKLTNNCNLRCVYCYQNHENDILTLDNTEIIIKFLKKQVEAGYKSVDIHWFGGEPLLNTAPIFEIERFLIDANISGSSDITTNGLLLDQNLVSKLKKTRISSFQITLDGDKKFHDTTRITSSGAGTFDKTIDNIKLLTENDFEVCLRINLNQKNQNLSFLLNFLNSLKINNDLLQIYVNETNDFELSKKMDNFYFQQLKDYSGSYLNVQKDFLKINMEFPRPTLIDIGCIFNATSSFLIETDLKLFFCTSSENNPSFEQGRILKDGNIELNYINYCSRVNSSPFDDDECMECKLLPICMGGCPLKRILGKEPCIPEKYYINDYVKLLYLEAIKNV